MSPQSERDLKKGSRSFSFCRCFTAANAYGYEISSSSNPAPAAACVFAWRRSTRCSIASKIAAGFRPLVEKAASARRRYYRLTAAGRGFWPSARSRMETLARIRTGAGYGLAGAVRAAPAQLNLAGGR